MRKNLILICLFFIGHGLSAQDIHFSQYYFTPLLLNPANTGAFTGDTRAFINYKDQWRGIDVKYQTMSASCDFNLLKKANGSYMGLGLVIFDDKSGEGTLKQTQGALSLAYSTAISKSNNLSAGLQAGYGHRSTDFSGLTWDNQYNGKTFDGTSSSGEQFGGGVGFVDMSGGILLNAKIENKYNLKTGVAVFHINTPNQSLLNNSKDLLNRKYVIHSRAELPIENTNTSFLPDFLFMVQGGHREINFGTLIRYQLQDASQYTGIVKGSSIALGAHYRLQDAFVITGIYEMANFQLGVSYDINTSSLNSATQGKGGIEFSLRFTNPNPYNSSKATPRI